MNGRRKSCDTLYNNYFICMPSYPSLKYRFRQFLFSNMHANLKCIERIDKNIVYRVLLALQGMKS